ncbi:MAG: hypothetical protein IJ631_00180, partial [Schwartzia sp.]|nr:hypothetical protein [Schwartzia sp. (in: firmicutes)]
MTKKKEQKLTRLILGALLFGGGTLGAPVAEAETKVIESGEYTNLYGADVTNDVADNNSVTVNGGKITDEIIGGLSKGTSNSITVGASHNVVTINEGATIGGTADIIGGRISGGYGSNVTRQGAHNNTININKNNLYVDDVIGGSGRDTDNYTNNTLNLGATGLNFSTLTKLQTIAIGYEGHTVTVTDGDGKLLNTTALRVRNGIQDSPTLDIRANEEQFKAAKSGTMTLLAGGFNDV